MGSARTLAGLWALALGLLGALCACGAAAAGGSSVYAGGYNGLGPASGMAMILEQDQERVYGRIVDGQSNVFQVNGQVTGNTVQGTLYNPRAQATFQLELRPSGISFIFVPQSADGRPNASAQKSYTFARGRVSHPSLADYRVPAPKPGDKVDVILFLENYRSWSYGDVAAAYGGVPEGDRALFRLFDHLHADLMLRLCRASADPKLIDDISEGQPIGCDALTAYADKAEAMSVMQDFYDVTEFQRGSVYTAFACDRGLYSSSRCLNVDKLTSHAAANWSSAKSIFVDLTESTKTVATVLGLDAKSAARKAASPIPLPEDRPIDLAQASDGAGTAPADGPVGIVPEPAPDAAPDKPLYAATRDVRLGDADPAEVADEAQPAAAPPDKAIKLPRRRPDPTTALASAEPHMPVETDNSLLKIRPARRPDYVASTAELASVDQRNDLAASTVSQDPGAALEIVPADFRPAQSPVFEFGLTKLPRQKPARFVPERVPHPRPRPGVSG